MVVPTDWCSGSCNVTLSIFIVILCVINFIYSLFIVVYTYVRLFGKKKIDLLFSAVGTTFLLMNDVIGKSFVKVPE